MERRTIGLLLGIAVCALTASTESPVAAPPTSGWVVVRVRDLSGNPLPRAEIWIDAPKGRQRGRVDTTGVGVVPVSPPGRHTLSVWSAAHQPAESLITVRESARDTVDIHLDILPELRGASIRMTSSGDAYVKRGGEEWILTRERTRWIVCESPPMKPRIDGMELSDSLFAPHMPGD